MSWLTWGNIGGSRLSNEVKSLSVEIQDLKKEIQSPERDSVSALGLIDDLFLDKETIEQIKGIVAAIDPEKVKSVMNAIQEIKEDKTLRLKIDFSLVTGETNNEHEHEH